MKLELTKGQIDLIDEALELSVRDLMNTYKVNNFLDNYDKQLLGRIFELQVLLASKGKVNV